MTSKTRSTHQQKEIAENNVTLGSNIQTLESRRRHLMEKKNNYRKRYNDEMKKYKRLDTDVTEIAQEIRDFDSKLTSSHKETAELDAIDKELEKET